MSLQRNTLWNLAGSGIPFIADTDDTRVAKAAVRAPRRRGQPSAPTEPDSIQIVRTKGER